MKAAILSIGDELILGQTLDTNSAWLSQQLAAVGCDCIGHLTVPDDRQATAAAIAHYAPQCDVLLISGGIGPTEDDLTRFALADVLQVPLEPNAEWMGVLEDFFRVRNRPFVESNRIQAMLPRGVRMLHNPCGTACGMAARVAACDVYVMPGVPREMKTLFQQHALPAISTHSNGAVILSRTLHTFGLGESSVGDRLGQLMDRRRNPSVGTTVTGGIVSLRLNARFPTLALAQAQLEATDQACRQALGDLIYGQEDQTLPAIVGEMLAERQLTVTTAESCTGGLLAAMFTEVPGSTRYFSEGVITYANQAKVQRLGVSEQTLAEHGAVSEQTVIEMATSARRRAQADFALAISGIAGPGGGSPDKPVGTVWAALAWSDGVVARKMIHPGDRALVRDRACKMALTLLRYHLLGRPLPF